MFHSNSIMSYLSLLGLILRLGLITILVTSQSVIHSEQSLPDSLTNEFIHNQRKDTVLLPETFMNVQEILQYHGYPFEEYEVTTDDGYILTIQRIPRGIKPFNGKRKPILLQHGWLGVSTGWLLNIPEKNLAYWLADSGYDVWLGNMRGNSYGRRHTNYTTSQTEFWDFSFHEIGMYDITAIIDHILNTSKAPQLDYIGHSMGGLVMLVTLSARPEYNNKVRSFQFWGPVAANIYMCSPLRYLEYFKPAFKLLENHEMFSFFPLIKHFNRFQCLDPAGVEKCQLSAFLTMGFGSRDRMNVTRLPVYMGHSPESSSVRNMLHIIQMRNGKFAMYSYGRCENLRRYGQKNPPNYNLSRITTPMYLYWSDSDGFASPLDVAILTQTLLSVKLVYEIPAEKFNHIDYFHAMDADRLVYDKVMDVLFDKV